MGVVTGSLITPVGPGDGAVGQAVLLATAMARGAAPHPVGEPERVAGVELLAPVPEPPSIRDFYAFEAHVAALTSGTATARPAGGAWADG